MVPDLVLPTALLAIGSGLLYLSTRLAIAKPPPWSVVYNWLQREPAKRIRFLVIELIVVGAMVCGLLLTIIEENPQAYVIAISVVPIVTITVFIVRGRLGRICTGAALIATIGMWLYAPNWLTANLVSAILLVSMVVNLQFNISFRLIAAITVAWAIYDAVQVFVTKAMIAIGNDAIATWSPTQFSVPAHLSLSLQGMENYSFLGLGDIFVPGLLVVAAGRIGQRTSCPWVYRSALGGYAVGLIAAIIVGGLTDAGQPALVYLVPGVIIAVMLCAWRNGLLHELAQRPPKFRPSTTPHTGKEVIAG